MSWLDDHFGLHDRSAVVTGGASGLGRAIAEGLAEAGAGVTIWDFDDERGQEAAAGIDLAFGAECLAVPVDVTDESAVNNALAATLDRTGSIEILVNSAGVSHNDLATEIPVDVWEHVLAVNLTGTLLCCKAVGAHMVERQRGSIVNIASIMAVVSVAQKVAYNASKGGVAQLTKTLAVEWAESNVRVNALAPSPFESPMLDYAMGANPELFEFMWTVSPFGRPGRAEEIMGPAIFLASDASSMVTGHVLAVDGGYLAH